MGIVAEKIRCRCGTPMQEIVKDISWSDSNGNKYTIRNVPTLCCNKIGCYEEYTSSGVQINVSILADEMRKGTLPRTVEYEERF
ncbi:hypothetical protein KDJ56_03325 [Brevibacillus composti]|uniref:YgiT-type zinc finger protein n=1 Tax=Brevibacillus composti TaxID=2796470 RepID=A0A7T5ELZ2_9BACL|nr:hypothetical protein [Brevibacillus composti]QQE74991.1 hypothetical protein JD108_03320 [Brevibacillus composti]QUO42076.1 hypothetical protein KDJ56_03325 [Brevibacillus composti]